MTPFLRAAKDHSSEGFKYQHLPSWLGILSEYVSPCFVCSYLFIFLWALIL